MLLENFKQLLVVNLGSGSKSAMPHLFKVIIVLVGHVDNAGMSNRFLVQ